MLASNFPVDKLIASFEQIYSGYLEILEEFSNVDKQKLFHDNAAIYYRPVWDYHHKKNNIFTLGSRNNRPKFHRLESHLRVSSLIQDAAFLPELDC